MIMGKLREEVENFQKVMDVAYDNFSADNDEMVDKFYTSAFSVKYKDKTTNTIAEMNFEINPGVWYLFESFVKMVNENIEDYEVE